MGPTCEVLLDTVTGPALDGVERLLADVSDKIERTHKGRVWKTWIAGRPVNVSISDSPPSILLSAGCSSAEDYTILRTLAGRIAETLGGEASEPTK